LAKKFDKRAITQRILFLSNKYGIKDMIYNGYAYDDYIAKCLEDDEENEAYEEDFDVSREPEDISMEDFGPMVEENVMEEHDNLLDQQDEIQGVISKTEHYIFERISRNVNDFLMRSFLG
jgi:hypothetical protein